MHALTALRRYIKREAAVILAVIPATSDFATMECIKMAQKVDPEGKRTLGVVTMIDKAEKGIQDK